MANVWPVYDGNGPTTGSPWARLAVMDAVAMFDLRADDFISELAVTPRFGDPDRDLWYLGIKQIVVEIEPSEGRKAHWKAGFYRSRVKPKEAMTRLIRQALAAELGIENVMRVEYEPTIDLQGRDALKVTVVIAPGAVERLEGGVVLDALVRLRARLREMGDDRNPIIEYATEAELAQDGGPQS